MTTAMVPTAPEIAPPAPSALEATRAALDAKRASERRWLWARDEAKRDVETAMPIGGRVLVAAQASLALADAELEKVGLEIAQLDAQRQEHEANEARQRAQAGRGERQRLQAELLAYLAGAAAVAAKGSLHDRAHGVPPNCTRFAVAAEDIATARATSERIDGGAA